MTHIHSIRPLTRKVLILAAACTWGLSATGCGDRGAKHKAELPPPRVQVAEVAQQTIPITMEFSGTAKAVKSVDIIPRVSGYIMERHFTEGDYVKEGAPLYLIDPRTYQADLDAAQAKLERDKASLAFWEKEVVRFTRLAKKGAGSMEDKEKAVAHRDETKATISQDQAKLDNAQLDLGFTKIDAPFTGRIQQTRINVGQLVEQQKDVLTTLVQIDPIHVVFNVSRTRAYEIQQLRREGLGMRTLADYKADLRLPDGSLYPHQGTLDFVSSKVDPTTDTLTVRAVFPNPHTEGRDSTLIVGQYVPVMLHVGHRDALLIPQPALVQSQAGDHVYVLKDGKVEHRAVRVDGAFQQDWVIADGLKAGEQVVVQGVQKVRGGMPVTVVEKKAPGEQDRRG
jgi:membrane fusion protein (multidrug efflux system)